VGDLAIGLVISALAMAAVFVYFGILAGCMSFLHRLPRRQLGGTGARQSLREHEKEIVALLSALYTRHPTLEEGEYLLRVGALERTLRVSVWGAGHGIVEVAGRSLEMRIRSEAQMHDARASEALNPGLRPRDDAEM